MTTKNKFKYSILSAVGGLSLLGGVVGAGAAGANLFTNAAFDDGADGWSIAPSTPWVIATGNIDGNLVIANLAPWDLKTYGMVGQCLPVEAGKEYEITGEAYVPVGQEREGGGLATLVFYGGVECGGGQLTNWETGTVGGEGQWGNLSLTRLAPAGAQSAWAGFSAMKNKPYAGEDWEAPFTVYFDNAYFGEAGESPAPAREEGEPVALEEPEELDPPAVPQPEDERPQGEPGDEPQDEPGDEPQDEPGDEPQDEPGDEPQDEPGDEPQDEPGDEPQDEPGEEPQDEPGEEPQDEPGDEPQDEPGDEPQAEPGDEPQAEPGDEPQDDQLQELDEPGEDVKSPLPPDTGTGFATDEPELMLAAGVIGAAMAVALGGTMLIPAKRKR